MENDFCTSFFYQMHFIFCPYYRVYLVKKKCKINYQIHSIIRIKNRVHLIKKRVQKSFPFFIPFSFRCQYSLSNQKPLSTLEPIQETINTQMNEHAGNCSETCPYVATHLLSHHHLMTLTIHPSFQSFQCQELNKSLGAQYFKFRRIISNIVIKTESNRPVQSGTGL